MDRDNLPSVVESNRIAKGRNRNMARTSYILDGRKIATLEGFYREIGEVVAGPGGYFGTNLDALSDCLSGGFGTPEGPDDSFEFIWRDSGVSRAGMSYDDTVTQLTERLQRCHPENRAKVEGELRAAATHKGATTFDWVIGIFEYNHVPLILD